MFLSVVRRRRNVDLDFTMSPDIEDETQDGNGEENEGC